MRVLVTGAGGFSGAHLVETLVNAGHEVTALVGRTGVGRLRLDPDRTPRLQILRGDLAGSVTFPDGVEAIVHTAAVSPGPGVTTADFIRSNTEATLRLVSWARERGVRKFIYYSSLSAFGRIEGPVLDESFPRVDVDAYGVSKWLGEQVLADQGEAMNSLSIRLPGVIGPRAVRNWLVTVVEAAREGREVMYYHGNADYNNAVHVEDLSRFVTNLQGREWHGHDMVALAGAGMIKVYDVVTAIAAGMGGRSPLREVPPWRPSFTISIAKAQKLYDYRPMEMRDMIARFVAENKN